MEIRFFFLKKMSVHNLQSHRRKNQAGLIHKWSHKHEPGVCVRASGNTTFVIKDVFCCTDRERADGIGADEILGFAQFDAPPEPLSLEHFPAEQSLFFKLLGRNSKTPWQASPNTSCPSKKKKKSQKQPTSYVGS